MTAPSVDVNQQAICRNWPNDCRVRRKVCKVAQENSKDWRIEVRVGSLNVRTMTGKDRELADMIEKERPGT